MKSKWIRVLLAVLAIWMAISYYFYTQHTVTLKEYNLNKTVRVGDTRVIFKQITLNNYSIKTQYGYNKAELPWYAKIIPRLPVKLQLPLFKACSFYTRPYILNQGGTLKVKGIIISPGPYEDSEETSKPTLHGNVSIDVVYNNSYTFGCTEEPGYNIDLFAIYRDNAPFTIHRVKAVITDKKTGKIKSLSISPDWNTKVYYGQGDLPPEFPFSPRITVNQLLNSTVYGKFDKAKGQSLILSTVSNKFPWKNLQHHYWQQARKEELAYQGSYKGYQDVYSIELMFLDIKTDEVVANQKFYLIDQGDKFKIIDVSKVEKNME